MGKEPRQGLIEGPHARLVSAVADPQHGDPRSRRREGQVVQRDDHGADVLAPHVVVAPVRGPPRTLQEHQEVEPLEGRGVGPVQAKDRRAADASGTGVQRGEVGAVRRQADPLSQKGQGPPEDDRAGGAVRLGGRGRADEEPRDDQRAPRRHAEGERPLPQGGIRKQGDPAPPQVRGHDTPQ